MAPFYGSAPPLDEVPNLIGPVLGIYAGDDDRINSGIPDPEEALQRHGKYYRVVTYPVPEPDTPSSTTPGNAATRKPPQRLGRRYWDSSMSI